MTPDQEDKLIGDVSYMRGKMDSLPCDQHRENIGELYGMTNENRGKLNSRAGVDKGKRLTAGQVVVRIGLLINAVGLIIMAVSQFSGCGG